MVLTIQSVDLVGCDVELNKIKAWFVKKNSIKYHKCFLLSTAKMKRMIKIKVFPWKFVWFSSPLFSHSPVFILSLGTSFHQFMCCFVRGKFQATKCKNYLTYLHFKLVSLFNIQYSAICDGNKNKKIELFLHLVF